MLTEQLNTRKARRDKRKTACAINRRKGCGICGSLNTCYQGVVFCNICGTEEEFLTERVWWSWHRTLQCNCAVRHVTYHKVGKCMDCGAVQAHVCPNHKRHDCWKKANKYFCVQCGYKT